MVLVPTLLIALVLSASSEAPLEKRIQARLERFDHEGDLRVGNEVIHASSVLLKVYPERGYQPAWTSETALLDNAETLLRALARASEHGLDPHDYHHDRILNLRLAVEHRGLTPPTDLLADLDLLLSDAFFMYASHLVGGAVDRVSIDPEWFADTREVDLGKVFEEALSTGRIDEALESLAPADPRYARLRRALAHYREMEGSSSLAKLGSGASLKPGARDGQVRVLRQRLAMALETAFPAPDGEDDDVYDETLVLAVKEIQRRYGLVRDGIVGGATREALNREPEDVVRQLQANLERWRWLPNELGERYGIVNIAGFELELVEASSPVLSMKVVVGRPYRRTPVLSSRITHVVLNPTWTAPETVVKEDILPRVRKDAGYLARTHLRVFDGWGEDSREVDPSEIDWRSVKLNRYRFRQDPGPWNALGRVKFLLPNTNDIYLHDTPDRELFSRAARVFSSGCVRLEKPLEFLDHVLSNEPRFSREMVETILAKGEERFLRLDNPLPVHILYWTAWVEEDGTVHFRNDIYGRDARLEKALLERPRS